MTLGLLTATAALTVDISLPAIPAMVDALSTNLSHGQQIVGIFLFGMALGQIPAGLLSDRMGRMPVLYTGMGIFALAAWVAAAANSIEVMLVARFVQGFGAAAAIVLSLFTWKPASMPPERVRYAPATATRAASSLSRLQPCVSHSTARPA